MELATLERAKRDVGYRAVDAFVRPGTCIGLGTGTTARWAIERVGELVAAGWSLRAVPTSAETARLCAERNIETVPFGGEAIDVAIDGADEVTPQWALVKGGGGALVREKAVAIAAAAFVVVVTENKLVAELGAFPLPVEVVPFCASWLAGRIEALGAGVTRRGTAAAPWLSDNGNVILDCRFASIPAPAELDRTLRELHGVVATGIFTGLASRVLVARDDGSVVEL